MMRKYIILARLSWSNGFVYRLNFIMWRVRQVLSLLTAYFLWQAVFQNQTKVFGYSSSQMLTYIMIAGLLQAVILSSRSIDLAGVINSGDLSNILIQPISNFWYWFSRDVADKILNIIFSIGELALLYFILRPPLFFPLVLPVILVLSVVLFLSTFLYYLINYLFGLLGFWTPQTWGARFVLFVVLQFVAGNMFPLDVLPAALLRVLNLTPFPYLIYFPTQVYLGRLSFPQIGSGLIATALWIVSFSVIVKLAWKRGLARYNAEGR